MLVNSVFIILIFSLPLFIQALEPHRRFVHVRESKKWHDARRHCRAHHTDLAVFRDQAEYEALQSPCLDMWCWIGLQRDDKDTNSWKWANGEKVSFTSWNRNEPNRLDEKCVFFYREKWADLNCERSLQFLCYDEDDLSLVKEEKTWEEALEHCRALQTDPTSSNTDHRYDLPHMHVGAASSSTQDFIQKDQTQEVWIGLRFMAGRWLWVDGFPLDKELEKELPVCPDPSKHCGTMSKTGGQLSLRDCSEKRNFFCSLKDNLSFKF